MEVQEPIREAIIIAPTLAALPLKGDPRKKYRVNDTEYIWSSTLGTYVAAAGGSFYQANYLTLGLNSDLTNERNFTPGENLVGTDGGANGNYTLAAQIGAFTPTSITVTPSGRNDNYNPTGWNGTYPNKATTIFINATAACIYSGLQGGADGRKVTFVNVSDNIVIFENESPNSSAANQFMFAQRSAFFLLPGRSVSMIYSNVLNMWIADTAYSFDYFEDFLQDANTTYASNFAVGMASVHHLGAVGGGGSGFGGIRTGVLSLGTSTSATGNAKVGMGTRTGTNNIGSYSESYLSLARVDIPIMPTGIEDFTVVIGSTNALSIGSYSNVAGGFYWGLDTASGVANAASNFQICWGNQGSVTKIDSGLAFATSSTYIFGCYNKAFTEGTFFYSVDGITYNIAGTIASALSTSQTPLSMAGIWKRAGTTQRTLLVDYLAASATSKR